MNLFIRKYYTFSWLRVRQILKIPIGTCDDRKKEISNMARFLVRSMFEMYLLYRRMWLRTRVGRPSIRWAIKNANERRILVTHWVRILTPAFLYILTVQTHLGATRPWFTDWKCKTIATSFFRCIVPTSKRIIITNKEQCARVGTKITKCFQFRKYSSFLVSIFALVRVSGVPTSPL